MKYYLAIDLGATSGRHIIGYESDGKIVQEEVHRFKTGMIDTPDGLIWDVQHLFSEILRGIKNAFKKYPNIESLSIDTWGVDYVLLNGDKEILPCYAYRNKRCFEASEEVNEIIEFKELYKRTGIQFAPFNTIYQLYSDLVNHRLDKATDYLMLPSYFVYKLTGIKTHEYTDESTGAFLNATTGEYDFDLIDKLGLPRKLFKDIKQPGYVVGDLLPNIQHKVGGNCKVILCASHDTASAFEAADVPSDGVLISSGTWSLLGIKSKKPIINDQSMKANYTNEGGVGYIRFLKNIMGMYIANKLKMECLYTQDFVDSRMGITNYKATFDVNDPSLNNPTSMKEAIINLLSNCPPRNNLELFESVYHSMAASYNIAIKELEGITKQKFTFVFIVGGGAKNKYLNKLVEEQTGKKVVALPIEATALGNIKIQMKASK